MDGYGTGVSFLALFLCFILQAVNISSTGDSLKINGDVLIGGLVSMHQKGSGDACVTPDLNGILTVEAILFALKEVNSKRQVKLKSTLGCDIRDTCSRPYKTALDLLINTNRSTEEVLAAAVGNLPQDHADYRKVLLLMFSTSTSHMSCIPSTYQIKKKPDLVSRTEFIFHAIARDRTNLNAIVDIAARYNWTYTGVVYDDSDEGKYRVSVFQQAATKKFVCIARKDSLPTNAREAQIQKFIASLKAEKNFSVIVMLTSKHVFKGIVDEAFKQKITDLTWIVSDASWDDKAMFPKDNTAAQGLFRVGTSASIVEFKAFLQELDTTPERNKWIMQMVASKSSVSTAADDTSTVATTSAPTQVPAVTTAQQQNASTDSNETTTAPPSTADSSTPASTTAAPPSTPKCSDPPCGVNKTRLKQLVKMLTSMADSATCTIDSIFAVAHALARREQCKSNCPENHDFHKYIQNVNFKSLSGHKISFDAQQNLKETEYKIWSLQEIANTSAISANEQSKLQLSVVGSWWQSGYDTPRLTLRPSKEVNWNTNKDQIPKSICHKPCNPGTYKALKKSPAEGECCWHCLKCEKNLVSKMEDSLACTACPDGYAASNAQDDCIKQFEDYAYWSDAGSLIMLFLMVAGICFSIYVFVVLFKNRETPVMRRAKNATLFLLPFVIILFLIPIPLLSKPNESSCEGYRAFFTLALCIPLTALIARSIYVDNRYYDSDGQVKESWGNSICTPRVAVATGTVVVHVVAIIIIAMLLPNEIFRFSTEDPFTVYIECSFHTGFGFLVVIFYVMFIATAYSILSMNEEITPENDMEVRWTSLCMFFWYAICFLYVAIAHGVVGKGKIWGLAFVDFLFAVNILACIYMPKWYVIVFQPEKNQADVSPWTMYVKTQEKAPVRLSEEESPVMAKRGNLASTAKESGRSKDRGDPDKSESQELIHHTDV